jgi:hypothetical protein
MSDIQNRAAPKIIGGENRLPAFGLGEHVRLKFGGEPMLVDFVISTATHFQYRCMDLEADGAVRLVDYYEDDLVRSPRPDVLDA